MSLMISFILLGSSLVAFCYGLIKYWGKHVALFSILVTAAMGCLMLGHLYEVITLLIVHKLPAVFHIGLLARIGGFAFLFSASYAQMDGLVDSREKKYAKYRMLPLLAPLALLIIYLPILRSDISTAEMIISAILFVFAGATSYYNMKHLIIPDVSYGIIAGIRVYSWFSLLQCILYGLTVTTDKLGPSGLNNIFEILLAVTYPCIMFAMERGRKKWIA